MKKSLVGLIGLAAMGKNLARNIANHGFQISVFNRTTKKTTEFTKKHSSDYLIGTKTLPEFIKSLEKPRKILLLVKAGDPVDEFVEKLRPLLDKNDIIIDCGNSNYLDTQRRSKDLAAKGLQFVGCGISGGEKGALLGPSIMPGGSKSSWKSLRKIFKAISAKDFKGKPCVAHIGPDGAGHFVKTVHNGIEYGIMQLIAESYDLLKKVGKFSNKQLAEFFKKLNDSYLMGITAGIFYKKDELGGGELIDKIKDRAAQKGTGRWTTEAALYYGVAIPTITAAVDARIISGSKRMTHLPKHVKPSPVTDSKTRDLLPHLVSDALKLSTICTYFQGFELLKVANKEQKWNLDLAEIARIWQGGCIIRSTFLTKLETSFDKNQAKAKQAKLQILKIFNKRAQLNWRNAITLATQTGTPFLATSASLAHYDAITSAHLPQNLIQAQRDFFGAHTYERIDKKGTFHTEWE